MIAGEDIKIGAVVRHLGGPDTWGDTDAEHFKLFTIVEDIGSLEKYFMENLVCRHAVAANKDLFELSTEFSLKALEPNNSIARPVLSERKVGKVRMELVDDGFANALFEIAKLMTWANDNKGYLPHDWKRLPNAVEEFSSAASRHRIKPKLGEISDPESKMLHKVHEAFNVLAQLELILTDEGNRNG